MSRWRAVAFGFVLGAAWGMLLMAPAPIGRLALIPVGIGIALFLMWTAADLIGPKP